jgi:hypothetical protein
MSRDLLDLTVPTHHRGRPVPLGSHSNRIPVWVGGKYGLEHESKGADWSPFSRNRKLLVLCFERSWTLSVDEDQIAPPLQPGWLR